MPLPPRLYLLGVGGRVFEAVRGYRDLAAWCAREDWIAQFGVPESRVE
jgi:hypothetical protein